MGRRLAQVEESLEFLGWVFGKHGHTQGRTGQVAGPFAALGELLQDFLIGDGDKVPGLGVLGGLRSPSGVEDGEDCLFGERLVREFAHGALEADGVADVHDLLFILINI